MGRTASGEQKYQIESLQDNHREMIRLAAMGRTRSQIALELECSPQMVGYVLNSHLAREQVNRMHDMADMSTIDVRKRLSELAPAAVETLAEIMLKESSSDAMKAKTAANIIDYAGYAPVRTNIIGSVSLKREDFDKLRARAISAGLVVEETDAEPLAASEVLPEPLEANA